MYYFDLFLIFNFFIGIYLYMMMFNHLLSILLTLEFMVLMVFFLMLIFLKDLSCFYSLFYLVLTVCEGALGLSILVAMGRSHGGDYFNSMNLLLD